MSTNGYLSAIQRRVSAYKLTVTLIAPDLFSGGVFCCRFVMKLCISFPAGRNSLKPRINSSYPWCAITWRHPNERGAQALQ